MTSDRPRVALVATTYFQNSHADVCGTKLIEGYEFGGRRQQSRVEVVSMYLEQLGDHQTAQPRDDIGMAIAERNGVAVYPTVAEALGCGAPGVAVDGVVIIGEHGDYEHNIYGQQLYPRRRLFDSAGRLRGRRKRQDQTGGRRSGRSGKRSHDRAAAAVKPAAPRNAWRLVISDRGVAVNCRISPGSRL